MTLSKKMATGLSILLICGLVWTVSGHPHRDPQSVAGASGIISIPDASLFAKVYVISDVHGMYGSLQNLLKMANVIDGQNNWIAGNSLLVVTGDSIDKGPQSLEVLDLWIKLQQQAREVRGELIHVLGNHEAEFLADPQGDKKAQTLLDELKSRNLSTSDLTGKSSPRGIFVHNEAVALVLGKWLFSHSGFYPDMAWSDFSRQANQVVQQGLYGDPFLLGNSSILEAKDWEKDSASLQGVLSRMDKLGLYGEVFGHQPGAFGITGRSAAKAGGRMIKIDNGMAPEAGSNPGSILVFSSPAEMNSKAYPTLEVIDSTGAVSRLNPE